MHSIFKRTLSLFLALVFVFSAFGIGLTVKSEAASQYVSSTVPSVYKAYVKAAKNAHPNWNFEFFYTGLDWNTVINEEAKDGRSLVSYVFPKSYRAIDSLSYNSDKDEYYSKDAGGWYNCTKEYIAYCMDPRNFFEDESIFQFEKLSYDPDIHNIEGVKAILNGSFMDGVKIKNTSGKSVLYAQAYMDAAKYSKVSPYHLAARTIQEVGKSGSDSTSGKYKGYEGIYNFYNIGAYAGSSPIKNGLKWASSETAGTYMRPWDSQYKSIVGGAEYIGEGYINNKQNTLYLEKFDVVAEYNDSTLYTHQYMGNITAAYSEGKSVYRTYSELGTIDNSFTFVIPVYNNMPSKASPLPIEAESPWCWLKDLKVDKFVLNPSSPLQVSTNTVTVNVPFETKKVTISATPYKSNSTVTGLAKKTKSGSNYVYSEAVYINVGKNNYNITVTSANGSSRTYKLVIIRQEGDPEVIEPETVTTKDGLNTLYSVNTDKNYISGVAKNTTVAGFVKQLGAKSQTAVKVYNGEKEAASGYIHTGMKVTVTNSDITTAYFIAVSGDLNSDSTVDIFDLIKVRNHILGTSRLKGIYVSAADINGDGEVNIFDLIGIRNSAIE